MFSEQATAHLHQMLGPARRFRDGQLEAIHGLVEDRARLVVVQKTGWGKSLVYFIATRMLRDRGAGTTFLVSPLLSLMRNQEEMAASLGLRALRITSDNQSDWREVIHELRSGKCDLLMVSPERLANERFRRDVLPSIERGIGMLVVDEAHCISDWGHDFRPDYRRIVQIVNRLPTTLPVLATTATANDRVVADIEAQIGGDVRVMRGPLARPTLRLQTIPLGSQSDRLAWLAQHVLDLPGSGIIYCLTVRDTELVAGWLQQCGIDVRAYNADRDPETRVELEQALLRNEVKALAATVALGMGFDKPDLGFVIHYQRPGSVIAYYQQIGRAGRSSSDAYAILLGGDESDEIQEYFINSAFPGVEDLTDVVIAVGDSDGVTIGELESVVNLPHRRLEQCLKLLEVDGVVVRENRLYQRTAKPWHPDRERAEQVTALRYRELERMQEFVATEACLMEFVARELDDPAAAPCGRCANCAGEIVPSDIDPAFRKQAQMMLGRSWIAIRPRKRLPAGALEGRSRVIEEDVCNETGLALCAYADKGLGDSVKIGKYQTGQFDDVLVEQAAEAIRATWNVDDEWWMTAVPSLRHPELVRDVAMRLATRLGIPFSVALVKTQETNEQKLMQNSAQQFENVNGAFSADRSSIRSGAVILVDDMVDSGWTFTYCGNRLRRAGSGLVYPFALAHLRNG